VVKFDRARQTREMMKQLSPLLRQHKGNCQTFVQINGPDGQLVTLKLPGDLAIKASKNLVDDIEMLLGSGAAQLIGAGSKRSRRLAQQQQLFAEEAPESAPAQGDEQAAAQLDAEMSEAEVAA
jgi:hypothetical protein